MEEMVWGEAAQILNINININITELHAAGPPEYDTIIYALILVTNVWTCMHAVCHVGVGRTEASSNLFLCYWVFF